MIGCGAHGVTFIVWVIARSDVSFLGELSFVM